MPAISADTMVLPRIPEPDQAAADRPVLSVTTAPSGLEGEGFPVRRAFAGVDLAALDPFVHMDQMGEVDYAPGEPKGTPWHPHRGFETVTYMLDGFLRHQDYDEVFDQLEYLLGMVYAHVRGDGAAPIGRFVWRRQRSGAPSLTSRSQHTQVRCSQPGCSTRRLRHWTLPRSPMISSSVAAGCISNSQPGAACRLRHSRKRGRRDEGDAPMLRSRVGLQLGTRPDASSAAGWRPTGLFWLLPQRLAQLLHVQPCGARSHALTSVVGHQGDVGPRHLPAAAAVLPVRRPVAAAQRLVGQPGRPDHGPVQAAVAQEVLHHREVGVVPAERRPDDAAEQVPHEEPVAGLCRGGLGRPGDGTVPTGAALTTTMRRTPVACIARTTASVPGR
jgi:hypothetical protein